jgi:hypothetical protein
MSSNTTTPLIIPITTTIHTTSEPCYSATDSLPCYTATCTADASSNNPASSQTYHNNPYFPTTDTNNASNFSSATTLVNPTTEDEDERDEPLPANRRSSTRDSIEIMRGVYQEKRVTKAKGRREALKVWAWGWRVLMEARERTV